MCLTSTHVETRVMLVRTQALAIVARQDSSGYGAYIRKYSSPTSLCPTQSQMIEGAGLVGSRSVHRYRQILRILIAELL